MKLIAGAILAVGGLLKLGPSIETVTMTTAAPPLPVLSAIPHYHLAISSPIDWLAIAFMVVGVGLMAWGIWEYRKLVKVE